MTQAQDEALQDKIQTLTNAVELLGNTQAACAFAIKFAKNTLEGADAKVLESSGPKTKMVELALEALKRGTEGTAVVVQLSSYVISMKAEIQSDYEKRGQING
jgi:hypothetical protein